MGLRASFIYGIFLGAEEQSYTELGGTFFGSWGAIMPPNRTMSQDTEVIIAGLKSELFCTGGEATSEIGMARPEYNTVVIADEVCPSLVNLSNLHGAKLRSAGAWAAASEQVLACDTTGLLLGCQMAPIEGKDRMREAPTTYRESILSITPSRSVGPAE
jgi:alkyl sulfatase BDS1-like metallo-beta-lactamase superfamily hydrolase